MSIIAFFLNIFLQNFVVIFNTLKLSKTPEIVLSLVVILSHWRFFIYYFWTPSATLPWTAVRFTLRSIFPFWLSAKLIEKVISYNLILTFLDFDFTASATQALFTLQSFPMQLILNISKFKRINKKLWDTVSLTYQEVGFKSKSKM